MWIIQWKDRIETDAEASGIIAYRGAPPPEPLGNGSAPLSTSRKIPHRSWHSRRENRISLVVPIVLHLTSALQLKWAPSYGPKRDWSYDFYKRPHEARKLILLLNVPWTCF